MDAMITHCRRCTPSLVAGFATLLAVTLPSGSAAAEEEVVGGVVIQHGVDPAQAKAAFVEAQTAMRDIVARLTELQAEYRKDGSDKRVIEADFNKTKEDGMAADTQLENAAFTLAVADPTDQEAREHCGAVVAAAVEMDDPRKALGLVLALEKAGAASADVLLLGASAAIVASPIENPASLGLREDRTGLDQANAWIDEAQKAGVDDERVTELKQMVASERQKVDAEIKVREKEAADSLPQVKLETSKGPIVVELFEHEAPNTVANFISLVEQGFYDGTPFHRVIGGFMAQGGDPTGTGTGGPGHMIACECYQPNARKHFLGSLSMAHAGKDTGGSQFFLTFRPTEHLDGRHTVFGRITDGFDVLPKLVRTEGPFAGAAPDRIIKAEVIRKGDRDYTPVTLPDPRRP
jgi:cyclophilin family peptidyl-prolyl cis-trans isomerase